MELTTGDNDKGRRLDRILRKALPECPLPLLHRLLRQGRILVDGKPARAQDRLKSGVTINIPLKESSKKGVIHRIARKPVILWEGAPGSPAEGLIAVNKPCGKAVHGPNSLETIVGLYLRGKISQSLSFKPGPLHRLDKPSSGIIVFSTSLEGARLFSSLMREHKVKKTYFAIVEGHIKNGEIWEDDLVRDTEMKKTFVSRQESPEENPQDAKPAITAIKPIASNGTHTLIKAKIITGRTHQIRAQAASHGHPLAGDKKYGGQVSKDGFFLHAWKLEFLEYSIEAPLPEAFWKRIADLFGDWELEKIC